MLGRRNPVEKIIKLVHEKGGVVLVDAAQAVLHETVDVTALDADFLAFSGHKMMAPMGIGVLYGKEKLLEEMPPFLTGGEMIETVTREGATYAELPHKFEAGTVNGAGAVGLAAAIDYRKEIGINTIQKREAELTKMLFDGMSQIPYVHILGSTRPEEHGGILSFVINGVHPHDIASILDDSQIAVRAGHHCAQPLLKHLGVLASARASLASADMMLDLIIGKTKEEALKLSDLFLKMIHGEATPEEIEQLEEASSLQDISHMPARVKCAVLGWHTMEEMLDEKKTSDDK